MLKNKKQYTKTKQLLTTYTKQTDKLSFKLSFG